MNTATITKCRACGQNILDGQLILEPDFNFETGLHAPENCRAFTILSASGQVMTDEDELARFHRLADLEEALELLKSQG